MNNYGYGHSGHVSSGYGHSGHVSPYHSYSSYGGYGSYLGHGYGMVGYPASYGGYGGFGYPMPLHNQHADSMLWLMLMKDGMATPTGASNPPPAPPTKAVADAQNNLMWLLPLLGRSWP